MDNVPPWPFRHPGEKTQVMMPSAVTMFCHLANKSDIVGSVAYEAFAYVMYVCKII